MFGEHTRDHRAHTHSTRCDPLYPASYEPYNVTPAALFQDNLRLIRAETGSTRSHAAASTVSTSSFMYYPTIDTPLYCIINSNTHGITRKKEKVSWATNKNPKSVVTTTTAALRHSVPHIHVTPMNRTSTHPRLIHTNTHEYTCHDGDLLVLQPTNLVVSGHRRQTNPCFQAWNYIFLIEPRVLHIIQTLKKKQTLSFSS